MTASTDQIRHTIAAVVRAGDVNLAGGAALTDVGVDSLSLLALLVRLEGEFGVRFDDADVFRARFITVEDLVTFVEERIPVAR